MRIFNTNNLVNSNKRKVIMFKEAYVSFEVARLLKEKGFNGEVHAYHNVFDKVNLVQIPCPTQQMAMTWLRETHNLFIRVGFGNDNKGNFLYMADIYDLTNDAVDGLYKPIVEANDYLFTNPKTYEEAVEAALKYTLENLI